MAGNIKQSLHVGSSRYQRLTNIINNPEMIKNNGLSPIRSIKIPANGVNPAPI